MRIFANYHKGPEVRFISHLDMQRSLQRAFRRAKIPLAYSQGFNPHPLLSFASALSVGYTSDAEWVDIRLEESMDPKEMMRLVNATLPDGMYFLQAFEVSQELPTLTALATRAIHTITYDPEQDISGEAFEQSVTKLLSGEIVVKKRTKGGDKMVDIRPQLISANVMNNAAPFVLEVEGQMNADGALPIELLMQRLAELCNGNGTWQVHRKKLYFENQM